jgi:NAD(P)-dependent dehydrogenase (short-subunit alcohol dehydrogenase family)
MPELAFNDRVVIVTGSGRGLGRAYAHYFADRGARVVINDTGGGPAGEGVDSGPAEQVVEEIRRRGGQAVASVASVADVDGARSIVSTALDAYGAVDAVINNAGILQPEYFDSVTLEEFMRVIDVGLIGSFLVTQAAWPHLVESGSGRIVMTVAAAMFGVAPLPSYSTAKAGVIGLTRSLASIGAEHGIKSNAICPAAATRLVGLPELRRRAGVPETSTPIDQSAGLPEDVAPLAALLAHEECPATGEIISASHGHFARIFLGVTPGVVLPDATPDAVLSNWDDIIEPEGFLIPASSSEVVAFVAEQGRESTPS